VLISLTFSLILTCWPVSTSFSIHAKTETLRFRVPQNRKLDWYADNVTVYKGFAEKSEIFSGLVELQGGVEVFFERIGLGPLRVRVKSSQNVPSVKLYDFNQSLVDVVSRRFVMVFERLFEQAAKGQSIVIPLIGEIVIGNDPEISGQQYTPLLISGKINLVGHSILTKLKAMAGFRSTDQSRFDGGEISLDLGDQVEIVENTASGLIVANQESAFTSIVHAVGKQVKVTRLMSEGYNVSISVMDRLKRDASVQTAWIVSLFILGLIRTLKKYIKVREDR
jgi:hypothetical protein